MQVIEFKAKVEVPADHVLITKQEFEEYQELKDTARWWNFKDLKERYNGHTPKWFKDHILLVPKFEPLLKDIVRRSTGSGSDWEFEPTGFAKFMKDYFGEI